jgi:hypothetical protein
MRKNRTVTMTLEDCECERYARFQRSELKLIQPITGVEKSIGGEVLSLLMTLSQDNKRIVVMPPVLVVCLDIYLRVIHCISHLVQLQLH